MPEYTADPSAAHSVAFATNYQHLASWCVTPVGQSLLQEEQRVADALLPRFHGYTALQYGMLAQQDFLASARMAHKWYLLFTESGPVMPYGPSLYAKPDQLPLANDSIDLIFLPHILDVSANPQQLLAETDRVLCADGHIIITGFNPLGLWGLARLALRWKKQAPWSGHFLSALHIRHCMSRRNFDTVATYHTFRHIPCRKFFMTTHSDDPRKSPCRTWHPAAAAWLLVARKRTIPITPIRPWHTKTKEQPAGMTEAASRHSIMRKPGGKWLTLFADEPVMLPHLCCRQRNTPGKITVREKNNARPVSK